MTQEMHTSQQPNTTQRYVSQARTALGRTPFIVWRFLGLKIELEFVFHLELEFELEHEIECEFEHDLKLDIGVFNGGCLEASKYCSNWGPEAGKFAVLEHRYLQNRSQEPS